MSFSGIELITRTSLNPDRVSVISQFQKSFESQTTDRNWSWAYLRRQFAIKGLEDLYLQYQQRLQIGFFSVFLVLQVLLNVSHIIALLVMYPSGSLTEVLPDIVVYGLLMALFWPMAVIVFREKIIKEYPLIPLLLSCISIVLLLVSDLGLPLYHKSMQNERIDHSKIRPAYATHTLLACYIFLPVTHNLQAVILGLTVTACHLFLLGTTVYYDLTDLVNRLFADAVYLGCLNGLGLYHRYMNEVTVRRTFLDRRACIESTYQLKYEKQQEKQLMLSILPRHIVNVVKTDIRNMFENLLKTDSSPIRKKPFSDMYVKEHKNVSILYADVVNYSKLTVSLPVQKLVETLNELFGRFDEASEEHDVLRIKFLGDCYYCVAGVPESNPHHATNCVNLGLDMISIIKEVREVRNLRQGLDMRIGIHSGNILSGLLGVCKWQYDIWSKDVVIANVMEQTGQAGKVHVTQQTADKLGGKYKLIPAHGEQNSAILEKYKIKTYFVVPEVAKVPRSEVQENDTSYLQDNGSALNVENGGLNGSVLTVDSLSSLHMENTQQKSPYNRRISFAKMGRKVSARLPPQVSTRRTTNENNAVGSRRITVFMDNNLYRYQQALKITDIRMAKAIKKMRYGIHERWVKSDGINPACLTFTDFSWELPYLRLPDPLFKYCLSYALIVALCMLAIHALNMPSSHLFVWIGFGIICVSLLLLMPFVWTLFVWNSTKHETDEEFQVFTKPQNGFLKLMYKTSQVIVDSLLARTLTYLTVCIALGTCSMLELMKYCPSEHTYGYENSTNISRFNVETNCVPAWQLSESFSLAILMSFFFLKIHFLLELMIGLIFGALYISCILIIRPHIFMIGETWNPHLPPQIAHIMGVVFLLVTLHLLDRQSEYMMRLDYRWKQQLLSEQEDATVTRAVNKMLLENILPLHVAKLYLNTNRAHDELYHEEYESVAVMFASLTDYALHDEEIPHEANERISLTLLNQIICDFDKLLFKDSFRRIEKIKVAGQTYMAACGLVLGRRDSSTSYARVNFEEDPVVVLARFATKMVKVLMKYNRETFQSFNLRVGISHGPVTAGVVGSQKPLYDIWGDAVNMASRMDTTGEPGKIQVTANTAALLMKEGIKCTYRGDTWIKGKEVFVKTNFVSMDSRFKLVQMTDYESHCYLESCRSQESEQGNVIDEAEEYFYESGHESDYRVSVDHGLEHSEFGDISEEDSHHEAQNIRMYQKAGSLEEIIVEDTEDSNEQFDEHESDTIFKLEIENDVSYSELHGEDCLYLQSDSKTESDYCIQTEDESSDNVTSGEVRDISVHNVLNHRDLMETSRGTAESLETSDDIGKKLSDVKFYMSSSGDDGDESEYENDVSIDCDNEDGGTRL